MASVNRGVTGYVGVIAKQVTSATILSTPDQSNGDYGVSSTNPSTRSTTPGLIDGDNGSTVFSRELSAQLPVPQ